MKTALTLALAALALSPLLFVYACSSDGSSPVAAPPEATPSATTTQTAPPVENEGGPADAARDALDGGCTTTAPDLDGGGLCGARAFGEAPAILTLADAAFAINGSVPIPPGIYDVTSGERTASVPYSWRETLVLDGTSYTQLRRFDVSNGNAGPTNSRSGTYSVANGEISFVASCAKNADGGDITGGNGTFRYEVSTDACAVELRMIVAGTLLTFKRR